MNWRPPQLANFVPKFSLPVRRNVPAPTAERRLQREPVRADRTMSIGLFWHTSVAIGILAVSVLMVGGLLHSRTPLPVHWTQQSDTSAQRVPFAAVKPALPAVSRNVHAPAVKSLPADQNVKGAPVASPELAGQRRPSPQVTQRLAKAPQRKSKPSGISTGQVKLAQRSRSSVEDGDYVADDVVVHYGNKN